ncbi:MAG: cupin domain-containing protein, partial [Oscillospiraceae bacterium]|nr:cupin domain-containing protein [Oscillospiraceae bacterium]
MLLERLTYADDFPININIARLVEDPLHYHLDIEFLYVLKGEILLKNGYCQYHLQEGDIFTNAGHEVHGMKALTEDNVVATIQISTHYFSQYFPDLSKACYRT